MPMVIAFDRDLADLQRRGVVVMCAQCEHAIERKPEKQVAHCSILRVQIGSDVLRLCSSFVERH